MRRFATLATIPLNGVYVTETYGPKGWLAGRYDREGFISQGKWFPTHAEALAYARQLEDKP